LLVAAAIIYKVMQKLLDIRSNILHVECQVTFATLRVYQWVNIHDERNYKLS
jgi:hypothetical protein